MTEYLNPLQLFRQSKKRTYYMPPAVFLGLSFRDDYASVAISDQVYTTAFTHGVYPRDQLMDKLGYELEGIIVANNNSVSSEVKCSRFRRFLHVFNTLHMERDKESMRRKNERKGKDEERDEFERKAIQHDFNIKMKRYEESKRRKKSKGRKKERVESKRKALPHKGRKESKGRKKVRVGKDKEREESKRKKRCKIIE
ncbi:hypothetical protein QYF36_010233 [Acer negundo]|nr:hypothetical protein QYF36_010233 [Acer negundo]